jgi:hypothetical protein
MVHNERRIEADAVHIPLSEIKYYFLLAWTVSIKRMEWLARSPGGLTILCLLPDEQDGI